MKSIHSLLSGSISALPAMIIGICVLSISREEYYWTAYAISTLIYFSASLLLGYSLPNRMRKTRLNHPGLWLFVSGGLAWLIALLSLALLNLTPLCVGKDNGDGINTFSLCVFYTLLVSFIYSPLILILLAFYSLAGGKILSVLNRSR